MVRPVGRAIVTVVFAAALTLPLSAAGATPKPSWTCIAGICLGDSRNSLDGRYGSAPTDIPSRTIRVRGGHVSACFWRCTNAVTEDGFTYYGGTRHPANRLLTVGSCDPLFRLPDGTSKGRAIPFGQRWNGYRSIRLEGGVLGWEKVVRHRGVRITVTLSMRRGRVLCADLERAS